MATTTTRKRKPAAVKAVAERPAARPRVETVEPADLDPKLIDPSPFQPRAGFPAEEISRLAFSISEVGLLQPVSVRVKDHRCDDCGINAPCRRYELVDGERRLRAVKQLKLPTIRAEIVEQTDAQARAIVLVSALERKDLNAIEEARAFRAAIDAGDAAGPTELAAQLGLSQGHVSNRLRLLGLPKSVQKRVISQEIPPTHARCLLPLKDHPKLLDRVLKDICRDEYLGNVAEFAGGVDYIVDAKTVSMSAKRYDQRLGRAQSVFTPTDEQREKLGLITVEGYNGKSEERATNVKLWEELQAAHVKTQADRAAKRQAKAGSSSKGAAKAKPLTPAQQKVAAEEERRKAKERAAQFRRKLYEWKIDWLRYLIGMFLGDEAGLEPSTTGRLLMYFASSPDTWRMLGDIGSRGEALSALLRDRSVKVPRRGYSAGVWTGLAGLDNYEAVDGVAAEFLAGCFWMPRGAPNPCVLADDVEAIADFLCIDLARAWKTEQAGPLSEAYWNLHNKDQLAELAKQLDAPALSNQPKGKIVELYLANKKLPLPKEVLKIKRPR